MKIQHISSLYVQNKNIKETRKQNTSFVNNPIQSSFNKEIFISFKAFNVVKPANPYEKGYEDIKLDGEGNITNSSKYLVINSKEDILALSKTSDVLNRFFILNTDIDMEGAELHPIGSMRKPFKGVFDGNGYAIKNFSINSKNNDVGFFGVTNSAKILNLDISNAEIKGNHDVGGFVGYAEDTIIENCSSDANVSGKTGIGGFIGISENCNLKNIKSSGSVSELVTPKVFNLFEENPETEKVNFLGGVIGLDNGSQVKGAYFNGKISSNNIVGGIIGKNIGNYVTKIEDSWFDGELKSNKTKGGIIGLGENFRVSKCVCLNEKPVGETKSGQVIKCISNITQLKNESFNDWSREFWQITPQMLPRLSATKQFESPAKIFLQDINNSRDIGIFPYSGFSYTPPKYIDIAIEIKPPKHYKENEVILEQIKTSTDPDWLFKKFEYYADTGWSGANCRVELENDEILLALVQNKHLPINRVSKNSFNNCCSCSPVYIASRFNKPYIFAEVLKRSDINLNTGNGYSKDVFVFEVMQRYPDDLAAYALYASKNPLVQKHLQNKVSKLDSSHKANSQLVEILNKMYPEVPAYDEKTGVIKIPRELFEELSGKDDSLQYDSNNNKMYNLDDVMKNLDVDVNYKDSNGNNIINIAAYMQDEKQALTVYKKAVALGTDPYNKNRKGETPIKVLLESGKNQAILAELITNTTDIYETNSLGENAIHVFSKNPESKGLLYISKAIDYGMSVNLQDNNGVTALMNAVENKSLNMFNFLVLKGANVNLADNNGQTALHIACLNCEKTEDLQFIYTLIRQNADTNLIDNNGCKPFDYLSDEMKALVNMDKEKIDKLNEDIDALPSKIRPINYNSQAEFLNDSEITETDTEPFSIGRPFKSYTTQYLFFDRVLNDIFSVQNINDVLLSVLKELANENPNFSDDLIFPILSVNHPVAGECIDKFYKLYPEKINNKNEFGETPLMVSVDSYDTAQNDFEKLCCISNIGVLLKHGADVNLLDNNSQNVIHRICQSNCLILLGKFLDMNANINQKDILNKTPIEYLSKEIANKMRNYFENYARKSGITLGIENILKGIK